MPWTVTVTRTGDARLYSFTPSVGLSTGAQWPSGLVLDPFFASSMEAWLVAATGMYPGVTRCVVTKTAPSTYLIRWEVGASSLQVTYSLNTKKAENLVTVGAIGFTTEALGDTLGFARLMDQKGVLSVNAVSA